MSAHELKGTRVAILATDGFEQAELVEPMKFLEEHGAHIHVLSIKRDDIQGYKGAERGVSVRVDKHVTSAEIHNYDMLILPGGVRNPDKLRQDECAVRFVGEFVKSGKPVAAICHAPWLLIEANVAKGKRIAAWPSLKTDLQNAGAHWVNQPVEIDGNLITSRKPDDIPQFNKAMLHLLVDRHQTA